MKNVAIKGQHFLAKDGLYLVVAVENGYYAPHVYGYPVVAVNEEDAIKTAVRLDRETGTDFDPTDEPYPVRELVKRDMLRAVSLHAPEAVTLCKAEGITVDIAARIALDAAAADAKRRLKRGKRRFKRETARVDTAEAPVKVKAPAEAPALVAAPAEAEERATMIIEPSRIFQVTVDGVLHRVRAVSARQARALVAEGVKAKGAGVGILDASETVPVKPLVKRGRPRVVTAESVSKARVKAFREANPQLFKPRKRKAD